MARHDMISAMLIDDFTKLCRSYVRFLLAPSEDSRVKSCEMKQSNSGGRCQASQTPHMVIERKLAAVKVHIRQGDDAESKGAGKQCNLTAMDSGFQAVS